MKKWTAWPWSVPDPNGNIYVKAANGRTVADVRYRNGRADCHLIAAAPELYEMLYHAVEIIKEHVPENALGDANDSDTVWPVLAEYLDRMDGALAKARGESQ